MNDFCIYYRSRFVIIVMRPEARFTTKQQLAYLNAFAALVHVVSGALGYFIARHAEPTLPLIAPLFEFVQSDNATSLITQIPKTISNVRVFQPIIAVEFITAAFHLIYLAALLVPSVDKFIKTWIIDSGSVNSLRWVEYAITASTMSAFAGINIGIADFYYFVRQYSEGFALQMCGFLLELLDSSIDKDKRLANVVWNIGSLLNVAGVGILLYQIFASKPHTNLFYYNVAPFAIWFNTFGIIAWLTFRKYKQFADPYFSERWYIILSLSTKVSVFWLGFSTFKSITESKGFSNRTGVDWAVIRYTSAYGLLGFVACIAIYDYYQWQTHVRACKCRSASKMQPTEIRFVVRQ